MAKLSAWLMNIKTEESYQLLDPDTRIGRSEDNDIVLGDKAISRRHALIRYKDGVFLLYDVGASVAIEVNHVIVREPHQLYEQDEILFGKSQFRFVSGL
jgi:pSer/pThr/pTyr-binding forkhead associated (FHA) protein